MILVLEWHTDALERVEDGLLFGDVNDLCKGEVDIVLGMLEESAD